MGDAHARHGAPERQTSPPAAAEHADSEKRIREKFNEWLEASPVQTTLNTVLTDMKRTQEVNKALEARVRSAEAKVVQAGLGQVDALQKERDEAVQQRDEAVQQRDAAVKQRDAMQKERDAAVEQGDAMQDERDEAVEQRDAMQEERDEAVEQRDALHDELASYEDRLNKIQALAHDDPDDSRLHKRKRDKPAREKLTARAESESGSGRVTTPSHDPQAAAKRSSRALAFLKGIVEKTPNGSDKIWVTTLIKELQDEGLGKMKHDQVRGLMWEAFGVADIQELVPPTAQRTQWCFPGCRILDASERAQCRAGM
jgi:hypothetical protein